jgi:hypothetical protein
MDIKELESSEITINEEDNDRNWRFFIPKFNNFKKEDFLLDSKVKN